jgi:hypothetical protein
VSTPPQVRCYNTKGLMRKNGITNRVITHKEIKNTREFKVIKPVILVKAVIGIIRT